MVAVPQIVADPLPPPAPFAGVPVAALPTPIPILPTQEVAVADPYATAYSAYARALPLPNDDLTRDFGWQIYNQMALDPQIRASLRVLVTAALNQPPQIAAAVPVDAAQADLATTIAAFCREALRRLPVPLEQLLFEMATGALVHGHKVAELVYQVATLDPAVGPQLIFAAIKPKPATATAFVQDAYGNDLGTLVARPGRPLSGYGRGLTGGSGTVGLGVVGLGAYPVLPGPLDNLYPSEKFPPLTWDQQDGDPRGQSALRAIYGPWWSKQQAWPGLLAYLARFGQPSVVVTMAPNAADKVEADGTITKANATYLAAAKMLQAGGVAVIPAGALLALLEASGDAKAHIDAIHLYDSQMTKGLLAATLASNESQHSSRAQATVHQDVLGLIIRYLKGWLAHWVQWALLRPLVRYNYGDAALLLTPEVGLGQTDPENLAALLQAYAQLAGPGGYWNPANVPPDVGRKLDVRAGLPERQMATVGPDGEGGGPEDVAPQDAGNAPGGSL